MHSDTQQYLLIIRLFGLFLKCPFREATTDCPFIDIRKMQNLELKFKLAEKMSSHPSCQENLYITHEACYRKRMQLAADSCQERSVAAGTKRIHPPAYHQSAVGQR